MTEVLDFARPIRFELAEADLNDVCRASAAAAWAGAHPTASRSTSTPRMPPIVTDAERLRTALVNILTNARHAVHAVPRAAARAPTARCVGDASTRTAVRLQTRVRATAGRSIVIQDRGIGITPEDMAHIFDPYFTTRRAGTASACRSPRTSSKGSAAAIASRAARGDGTEIRIDLPHARPRTRGMTSARGTILLADDEEKILKRLGRALRDEGHEVVEATTHPRGAATPRRTPLRPARRGQRDAGHDRARADSRAVADDAAGRTAADRA